MNAVRKFASLVWQPDAMYEVTTREVKSQRRAGVSMDAAKSQIRASRRAADHRTWQEREQAIFGPWLPFICAMRSEEQNVAHVGKSQATMRWKKAESNSVAGANFTHTTRIRRPNE